MKRSVPRSWREFSTVPQPIRSNAAETSLMPAPPVCSWCDARIGHSQPVRSAAMHRKLGAKSGPREMNEQPRQSRHPLGVVRPPHPTDQLSLLAVGEPLDELVALLNCPAGGLDRPGDLFRRDEEDQGDTAIP